MDRILLNGMTFFGRHGVHQIERDLGARFTVDAVLELDLVAAGASDCLEDTLDYVEAYRTVRGVVEGEPCQLIEAVAEKIASGLLSLALVERVTVRVHKRPSIVGRTESVAVEIARP